MPLRISYNVIAITPGYPFGRVILGIAFFFLRAGTKSPTPQVAIPNGYPDERGHLGSRLPTLRLLDVQGGRPLLTGRPLAFCANFQHSHFNSL